MIVLDKNELTWIWSVKSFCRTQCPRKTVVLAASKIRKTEIILEAPGCVKMEVEKLVCLCQRTGTNSWRTRKREFMNGLNGEIYSLREADGICGHFKTLTIYNRVTASERTTLPIQPLKLKGVARIFEARHIIRRKLRKFNGNRVSGNNAGSSGDEDD